MSAVFVDTSAVLALLVSNDRNHARAARAFRRLQEAEAQLLTTSYVLVETYALLRRRVGIASVRRVRDELEPLLDVVWVGPEEHRLGLERLEGAPRGLSLVDAVSLTVMQQHGIHRAFAYDRDFAKSGVELV